MDHSSVPAPTPQPAPRKGPNLLASFLLGAGIEAVLNVLWLKLTKEPVRLAYLARSALFSGVAVATVYELSKTKPVKQILDIPEETNHPTTTEWVDKTRESSQNCNTPARARG